MKTFDLEKHGTTYKIQLNVTSYMEGNLAVTMTSWENGGAGAVECPDGQSGIRPSTELRFY